jgi:hypothetical protein
MRSGLKIAITACNACPVYPRLAIVLIVLAILRKKIFSLGALRTVPDIRIDFRKCQSSSVIV